MLKQRQDSLSAYEAAGRDDLAAQETFEIELIREFMPAPLTEQELLAAVAEAVAETGAGSMKNMGAVMALLKDRVGGRADMGRVSAAVKARLSG
jgi:uncharacterized protein YqeY